MKDCLVRIAVVGIRDVSANQNIAKLVMGQMSKVRERLVTANIKSVAKNVPDTTTPPAIFLPDMSKTEAVRAVPVLNIRLNAIPILQTPELMSTAVRRVAAGRAVKMTAELITPNALVRPCMNGARRRKNASAQRGINTSAPVATLAAVRATAAMENIRNVNVKPDSRGVPPAACAFVTARIGARSTKTVLAWGIKSRLVPAEQLCVVRLI